MKPVAIPSLGVAMSEALLVGWLKAPGDSVEKGEPIAEIETDKTTVQLESPAAGSVGPLLFAAGEIVPIGQAITHILEAGETAGQPSVAPRHGAPAAAAARMAPAAPSVPAALAPPASAAAAAAVPAAPATDRRPAAQPDRAAPTTRRAPHTQSPRERQASRLATAGGQAIDAPPFTAAAAAATGPIDLTDLPADALSEWLATMMLIREFEGRLDALSMSGKIPGGVHLSIGQEAAAVGAIRALRQHDLVAGGHRSHHHAIAKGLAPPSIMAELFGKATGCVGGRGGTMHLADISLGYLGGNGIVGASVGIAMGAALAAQIRGLDQVAVAFVGDGAANTGRTWESVNLAAIWSLPLIVICENNGYAVETATERVTAGGSVAARAAAFGVASVVVDGQDAGAMYRATLTARERARSGGGPTFIEAMTYRYEGHSTGQVITYRTVEELRVWQTTKDPIDRLQAALVDAGLIRATDLVNLADRIRSAVDDAIAFADASPLPSLANTRATIAPLRGPAR